MNCLHLKKIRSTREGRVDKFLSTWEPLISHSSSVGPNKLTPSLFSQYLRKNAETAIFGNISKCFARFLYRGVNDIFAIFVLRLEMV